MKHEKGSGHILCNHCDKDVIGDAEVYYRYESDYVEDIQIYHKACVRLARAAKEGKTHKCPKCHGNGKRLRDILNLVTFNGGNVELIHSSEIHRKPNSYNGCKIEFLKEIHDECTLCDSVGFLEKEPIPVITDWRKG